MCGLLLNISANEIDKENFLSALSLLDHRGPDAKNFIWSNNENLKINIPNDTYFKKKTTVNLILGHTRLSIVDLTPASNQPMISEDKRYALAYNGEIYNFKEIRDELIYNGMEFVTSGDTEVLLKAFIFWGIDCVKKFNGMWSFIIYDNEKKNIYLSRDPLGKKPLYYYLKDKQFIVGSEFKSIFRLLNKNEREVNPKFLSAFLFHDHSPTLTNNETFYSNILNVEPGNTIVINTKTFKIKHIKNNIIDKYIFKTNSTKNLETELQSCVDLRLRTDVPIAVLVSGGVDSSLMAALVKNSTKIKKKDITFYTANSPNSSDLKYAKTIAKSLNVKIKIINIPHDSKGIINIEEMLNQYEIPLQLGGLSSAAFYMNKKIAEDGIKVIIDGTGGDEIFSGYHKEYRTSFILSLIYSLNLQQAFKLSKNEQFKNLKKINLSKLLLSYLLKFFFIKNYINKLVQKKISKKFSLKLSPNTKKILDKYLYDFNTRFGNNNFLGLKNIQLQDIKRGKLPNWMFLSDQNSMKHSLELRSPLLDTRLLKYLNLNINKKIKLPFWKYPLRKILSKYDKTVAFRNEKIGFEWNGEIFLIDNKNEIFNTIRRSNLINSIFDIDNLFLNFDKIINNYTEGKFYLRVYTLAILDNSYNLYLK